MKDVSNFTMSEFDSSPQMSRCWVVVPYFIGFAKRGVSMQSTTQMITCVYGNVSSSLSELELTKQDQQKEQ